MRNSDFTNKPILESVLSEMKTTFHLYTNRLANKNAYTSVDHQNGYPREKVYLIYIPYYTGFIIPPVSAFFLE